MTSMPSGSLDRPRIDAATLADFLSGKLPTEIREDVLSILADSPADREVLLSAIRAETDGSDAGRPGDGGSLQAMPPLPGRAIRSRPIWYGAAGSAVAAVLLLLVARRDPTPELNPASPLTNSRGNGSVSASLRDSMVMHGWGATRGSSDDAILSLSALRMGVYATLAQRAAAMQDETLRSSAVDELATLAERRPGGSALAVRARSDSAGRTFRDPSFSSQLRAIAGHPSWYDVGVWMETVRGASLAGAMERPAVRRKAYEQLKEILAGLPMSGGGEREQLATIRAALDTLMVRLSGDRWSPVDDGAILERAFSAGSR